MFLDPSHILQRISFKCAKNTHQNLGIFILNFESKAAGAAAVTT